MPRPAAWSDLATTSTIVIDVPAWWGTHERRGNRTTALKLAEPQTYEDGRYECRNKPRHRREYGNQISPRHNCISCKRLRYHISVLLVGMPILIPKLHDTQPQNCQYISPLFFHTIYKLSNDTSQSQPIIVRHRKPESPFLVPLLSRHAATTLSATAFFSIGW